VTCRPSRDEDRDEKLTRARTLGSRRDAAISTVRRSPPVPHQRRGTTAEKPDSPWDNQAVANLVNHQVVPILVRRR
jgi:hypothetical protein